MNTIVFWASIAVLALFLIVGFFIGMIRGLKRSSLHLLFFVVSVVVALLVTKTVTDAILKITITSEGVEYTLSEYIINAVETNVDLSNFATAETFLNNLPKAIVSPILFMLLTLVSNGIFDIIYLIVARLSFGKKKNDFKAHKPFRAYGALIGLVEGFMFMILLFAPLTSLTQTYAEIAELEENSQTQVQTLENNSEELKTIGQSISEIFPKEVNDIILAYNQSAVGKIASAGGIDNALFDYMSTVEIDGEKIEFRKEVVSMTSIYDEFVSVYNKAKAGKFSEIDLTNFKTAMEEFLDKGLFKKVISDTVNDLIVKFDTVKGDLGLENLPQTAQDIISDLYEVFSDESFSTYEYIKHDILKIVDVFDEIFKGDLITKFNDVDTTKFENIMNVVGENEESVKAVADNIFNLNLVRDGFNTVGKLLSDQIEQAFENEDGIEVGVNLNIENKDQMIKDALDAVKAFIDLNKKISISELFSSTDIIETLTSVNSIQEVLVSIGTTFDKIRNLNILILPEEEGVRTEKVYVFDNILKIYGAELLGDEVYWEEKNPIGKTTLSTYENFFEFISQPIDYAKTLGLTDFGKEGVTFDSILDRVLMGLARDENLFVGVVLPFYQLNALDLKTIVFEEIIDQISENVSLPDLDDIKKEDDYQTWKKELGLIGKALNILNRGSVEEKTYLKYLIQGDIDLEKLMKAMISDKIGTESVLSKMLEPVLSAKTFKKLSKEIFDEIDSSISELTGSTISTFPAKTDLSVFDNKDVRTKTISTIEKLLDITLNNDLSSKNENALSLYGKVLEILRVDAYNNGEKNGVFNEIFTHVIWYLTGDNISSDANKFNGLTPNENAEDIKKYIGITNVQDYYTYEDFEEIMIEIQDVIDFADTLETGLKGYNISATKAYAEQVQKLIDAMDKTEAQKIEIFNNMKKMLSVKNESLLSDEDHTTYDTTLTSAINEVYSTASTDFRKALIELFTFNPTAE